MADEKKHTGGCHCGKVRYEVTFALGKVIECNCSMCSKKGTLLAFVPFDRFKLLSGEDDLTDYLFKNHVIHHNFCRVCGVTSFARGKGPDGADMAAINVRCLDGVDLDSLERQKFDGRSL
jgi:hypothetical protein